MTPGYMLSHSKKYFTDEMKVGYDRNSSLTVKLANGATFTLTVNEDDIAEVYYVSAIGYAITSKASIKIAPFTVDRLFAFANHIVGEYDRPVKGRDYVGA